MLPVCGVPIVLIPGEAFSVRGVTILLNCVAALEMIRIFTFASSISDEFLLSGHRMSSPSTSSDWIQTDLSAG